jgi:hypothetical protein
MGQYWRRGIFYPTTNRPLRFAVFDARDNTLSGQSVLEVYFPWVSWLFRVAAATQKGDKFAQLNMEEITGLTGPMGLLVQNITASQAVNFFYRKRS